MPGHGDLLSWQSSAGVPAIRESGTSLAALLSRVPKTELLLGCCAAGVRSRLQTLPENGS